jgi:nicotinamidase-related amidase
METEFFSWLESWKNNLVPLAISKLESPEKIAVVSVDMVNGFCHKGPLASKQVEDIIPNVVDLFKKANEYGIKNFLLLQDAHKENAEEFNIYPPHCIKGTEEAQNIKELASLPFSNNFTTFEKNAWSPAYDTKLNEWIKDHPEVEVFIIVGDCTDICIHATAMHLRMQSTALQIKRRIIVPSDAVATYDISVEKAKELKIQPHPSKIFHLMFLYQMALNGIEIVKKLE